MKILSTTIVICALGLGLTGCYMDNESVGTVGGAVAGGAIGAGLSHGNPAAIVGGAVVGGFVGNQVGQSMDERDYYYGGY